MNWILIFSLDIVIKLSAVASSNNIGRNVSTSDLVEASFTRSFDVPVNDTGDRCVKDGQPAVCTPISKCQSALTDIVKMKLPQACALQGSELTVCCVDDPAASAARAPPTRTTSEDAFPAYEYEHEHQQAPDGCEPIPSRLTTQRTGRKAWDKCIEYQEKYVYPCESRLALGESKIRVDHCGHDPDELDAGGASIRMGQFPHMVLLSRGDFIKTNLWNCGGTIISEKFVLTAAQCTIKDEVIYVRSATVKKSDALDPKRLYKVARIVRHPDYNEVEEYNDIALLETQTEMLLDRLAMPACLPVGDSYNDSRAVALGFGGAEFFGKLSDSLNKVVLTKFSSEECAKHYKPASDLPYGIKGNIHLCYGDKIVARDTCTGDSGGPLHIDNKDVHCMFSVIGITTFGIECGIVGVPGLYTRVAAYTPWIESIVWPD